MGDAQDLNFACVITPDLEERNTQEPPLNQVSLVLTALVQSHPHLSCDPVSSLISATWVGWEIKGHTLTYSFTFFVFTAL